MTDTANNFSPAKPDTDGWLRLRALSAAGTLAQNYEELPALLAEMDDDGLYRAGRLLSRVDTQRATDHELLTAKVFITSNFTCSAVCEFLTAQMARHGIVARCEMSAFNQYVFDLGSRDNRLGEGRDLTLCLLDAHVIFDALAATWTAADLEMKLTETLTQLEQQTDEYLRNAPGTLVLNTLPLPKSCLNQLLSYRERMRIGAAWRDFNGRLLRLAVERERLIVIDMDALLTCTGPLGEGSAGIYARAHFRDEVLCSYACEVAHVFKALSGRTRKCLVVDLDGTLWGGVLGDAGAEGIGLGEHAQGPAFRELQRVLRQISSQGVLLAICSKNDDDKVRHVLREHPDMLLRESDFAAVRAN